MTNDPNSLLTTVSGKYGAPMGRSNNHDDDTATVTLFRVRFVDGDYDCGGVYWGGGRGVQPLYAAIGDGFEDYRRADSLEDARRSLLTDFPGLTIQTDDVNDDFLAAYIECALWASMDNADESGGEPLDANYSPEDIAPETLERMRADCAKFYAANRDDIDGENARAGHDFWLTRNGHGAGFWDGGWPEEIGERLTAASKAFGEADLYVGDDGLIYLF